jgi:alanyl-tRNA synthetase
MIKTEKLYYQYPYLKKIEAKVIDILPEEGVILDKTIAYPEGGGQLSDKGYLIKNGKKIPFFDVQKKPGRTIFIENFPTIQVDNPIVHYVDKKEIENFKIGDIVSIEIDTIRRAKLSISHSVTHIVLMGIEKIFPGMEKKIYGAKIKEDSSRLDFRTKIKFSQKDIQTIEEYANQIIKEEKDIETFPHPKEKEARYWKLDWYTCACGGTHIENTKYIKNIKVKRKNLGKNGQRINISFDYTFLFQERFYE